MFAKCVGMFTVNGTVRLPTIYGLARSQATIGEPVRRHFSCSRVSLRDLLYIPTSVDRQSDVRRKRSSPGFMSVEFPRHMRRPAPD